MTELIDRLSSIQENLRAPKGQNNTFGKYRYRSCEDILESVKPHLKGAIITLSDDIVIIGDRIYVKVTATITVDGKDTIETHAFAREPLARKGMDDSQITGAASSYARKYALSGLLLIDDTKDSDTMDNTVKEEWLATADYFKMCQQEMNKVWPTLTKKNQDEIIKVSQR